MSLAEFGVPTTRVAAVGPTDAELDERFAEVFGRIAEGAVRRERERILPYQEVGWLRDTGFTRIRVPVELGGLGASLTQLFRQLIELGRADSNLVQLLRGHCATVESRLAQLSSDPAKAETAERWLRVVGEGDVFGIAGSERTNSSFRSIQTRLDRDGDRYVLNGEKFYSTGSLFADWISTSARLDEETNARVFIRGDAPGVTRVDDWDGFGQRMTGSGTTTYDNVPVDPANIEPIQAGPPPASTQTAFFQLMHLAALAGIGRAAVADVVAFTRQRRRNLWNPAQPLPAEDPLVQQVVGSLVGASFAAEATTLAAVEAVAAVNAKQAAGEATPEDFDHADAVAFGAQGQVVDLVLGLVSRLFEVGGSSAVREEYALDRHWRNARTLASHNPVAYRDRAVGEYALRGTSPRAASGEAPGGSETGG